MSKQQQNHLAEGEVINHILKSRRLFNIGLWLGYVSKSLSPWLYLITASLLAMKVFLFQSDIEEMPLYLIAATIILPLIIASIFTYRGRYSNQDVAAWLDLKGNGGGAVIAAANTPPNATCPMTLSSLAHPTIGIWPALKTVLIPALMVCIVVFIPWQKHSVEMTSSLDTRSEMVNKRMTLAKQLNLVTDAEMHMFKQHLDQAKIAGRRSPEGAAESIDTIDKQLDKAILKSASLSRKAIDAATRLLAESRRSDTAGLPDATTEMKKTMDEIIKRRVYNKMIESALKKLAKEHGLKGGSPEQIAQGLPMENMNLEQLRSLAHALQNGQMTILDQAALANGLLSGSEARAHLALLNAGLGTGSGAGGVDRGPGTAPLKLGEETDTKKVRFKPLSVKRSKAPMPGALVGKRQIAGGTEPPPEFQPPLRSGVIFDGVEGGSGHGTHLSPRNQAVTTRYFTEDSSDK